MAFDAGSISASLSIDTAKADADLKRVEDRVKELTGKPHKIKISAVFDDSSTGKARAAFAALDNAISRDAMQRLRSSPQGSVLGALNALFSPHPVTGAPSAQQSASQGLLGKMFAPQGGGNTPVSGGGGTSSQGGTSANTVRNVLTGQQPGNTATTNTIRDVTQGQQPGNITTTDTIRRDVTGTAPGDIETTDTIREKVDPDSKAQVIRDSADTGDKSGAGFAGGFAARLAGMFAGFKKSAGGAGASGGAAMGKGLLDGIGPGILGINLKTSLMVGGIGTALAALPAVAGLIGTGMGVAMVGGLVAEAVKGNAKIKAQFKTIGTDLQSTLTKAAAPIIPALSKVLDQVPSLLKSLEPQLAGIFKTVAPQLQSIYSGLLPIVHGLVGIAQAAAPAFGPFVTAIEKLVSSLLPGIAVVIRATVPVLSQFGQIMGTLGKNLGGFFAAAAPAVKASMTVLSALLGVVGSLLPVIVKLGDVFAKALAPVITQLAGALKALTPFFSALGGLAASLAGAVLGDLVSAFTALAQLLTAIAPGLTSFTQAISAAFTVLENSGVFATLGDALENLVPLLAKLVNQVLTAMTPLLPPIVAAFSQLSQIMITSLSSGLQQILPPLTQLAITVMQALATSLPVVLPILGKVFAVFTTATADAIAGIVKGLSGFLNALPKPVLDTLAGLAATLLILKKTGVISLGIKVVGAAQKLFNLLTGGGAVSVSGDAAAGAMKLAMQQGGADAAAAMKEAMASGGTTAAGEEAAGEEAGGLAAGAELGAGEAAGAAAAGLTFGQAAGAAIAAVVAAYLLVNFTKKAATQTPPAVLTGGSQGGGGAGFLTPAQTKAATQQNAAANASPQGQGSDKLLAEGKDVQAYANDLQGLNGVFTAQAKTAQAAMAALDTYTASVKSSGTASQASKTDADELVANLEGVGVSSSTAQADVANYTSAVAQNGISSSQAQAARQQLVSDILAASGNAKQGQADLQAYTSAVQQDGASSQAAQGARAQLIKDLENAGLSAQEARQWVSQLGTSIKDLPAGKTIQIHMDGTGLYTITGSAVAKSQGPGGSGNAAGGLAAGGFITQGTTPTADDVPIMASRGEYVVQASSVSKYGTGMMNAINAGAFASGGVVGGNLTPGYIGGMYDSFQGQMTASMVSAMRASIKAAEAASKAAAASAGGGGGSGAVANGSTITAALESLGVTGTALADALKIISLESGGSLTAQNSTSSAYGIAQFINGPSEYYTYGGNPNTVAGQITAFVNYVKSRYGTFQAALAFHLANGYYAAGGLVGGGIPGWLSGGPGGQGGWLQGLPGMMSGASGGSAAPAPSLPATAFVGNYTGVVSPASGAFGITAQQLGLPPPPSAASSSSSPADSGGSSGTSGSTGTSTPAPAAAAAKPAALNAAQKAAIAVLEALMPGLIHANKTGEAAQANALLKSLGVTKYDSQLSQIGFLDTQLSAAEKAKNKKAVAAAEKLLGSFGVHVFTPVTTAKGNAPKTAVTSKMESLVKAAIKADNMTSAGQANKILTGLGTGKYTSELATIGHLNTLLAAYKKKKDTKDTKATEALLKAYGVGTTGISSIGSSGGTGSSGKGSGAASSSKGAGIVSYAQSFLGKIPYVFGGTSLTSGDDCSAFVQAVLAHAGISAPRTSEAQGAWVTRGAPVPGGLAFYHSPAGGPDPGHVAIVASGSQVISQGGPGKGPKMIGLHALPLLWTGTPKGFAAGGVIPEPVIGFGTRTGGAYTFAEHGPETVLPTGTAVAGSGDLVCELRLLRGQMDKLIQTTASVPHGVTSGIGSALGGAAQSASFSRRYHGGG